MTFGYIFTFCDIGLCYIFSPLKLVLKTENSSPHIFWRLAGMVLFSGYFLSCTLLLRELRQRFFELDLKHCTLTKNPLRRLNPIQDEGGGGAAQRPPVPVFPLYFLQTKELAPKSFWLLLLTLLPYWCKISSLNLAPIPNYWTWTRTTPKKSAFSGQILIKLRLW